MKQVKWFVAKAAAVAALAALVSASAFADSRHPNETWRDSRAMRHDERVVLQGYVTSVERQRDGYLVYLDRSRQPFFIHASELRGRRIQHGMLVQLGGIHRRGTVYVDTLSFPRASYGRERLTGTVERIDFRRDVIWVRDRDSRRVVEVDLRLHSRRDREDAARRLRRGDSIVLSGEWTRQRRFEAYRIDAIRYARF